MKFGVGVDYSLKALLMLAERYPSVSPLRVEEIAAAQAIPENYLRRLLIELKRGGLVASQKGPSGGYVLARHPARITMGDVVQIIEGDYSPVDCLEENGSATCPREQPCPMREAWREVRDSVNTVLRRTTLQSLSERRRGALTFSI
jgi:Rrf2 family cysteine metabolism transcriptional repressor